MAPLCTDIVTTLPLYRGIVVAISLRRGDNVSGYHCTKIPSQTPVWSGSRRGIAGIALSGLPGRIVLIAIYSYFQDKLD